MEDFSKMIEAYRWSGGDFDKKKHDGLCASLCSSPALATPCRAEEEKVGFTNIVRSTYKKDNNGCTEPRSMGPDAHIQSKQSEPKSCVSDDDGDVGSQKHLLKKKPRASSRSRSSRQLVFSIEVMDAKSDLEGRVKSTVKSKRETKKKRRQAQTKQNAAKAPCKQGAVEDCNMPEFYDDSACEDGPTEFCSSEVSYSPGVVSRSSQFELANTPASNKRKRRTSSHVTRHVLMNGKSPFFVHPKQTRKSNDLKKGKKTLSSTLISKPENKTATVKAYFEKKGSPISLNDGGTVEIAEVKELSGHLRESSDRNQATSKAKKSAYFTTIVKALGQRDIVNKTWVPPISVHALIQEEFYQDPWKVLVACMLLNKSSGTQMRKVIWDLFALCPTPEAAVAVETEKVEEVIRPLGLQKKRARMIQKFSKDYLGKEWLNVGELHGIGKYATDAYAIFCEGRWREVKPEDHKLVDYWRYLCATDGLGYAFKDDREKGRELITSMSQAES